MFLISNSCFAQAIQGGTASWKSKLNSSGKISTKTKIQYLANVSAYNLDVMSATVFHKRRYTGGNFVYNKTLGKIKLGVLPSGYGFENISYKGTVKPFASKGYVSILIMRPSDKAIYNYYLGTKKYNFGLLSPSRLKRDLKRSVKIAPSIIIDENIKAFAE